MGLLSRILKKKVTLIMNPPKNLPTYELGLHLGSSVKIDPTMFILATGLDFELLGGDFIVSAIGQYTMLGVAYRTFYLADPNNEDTEYVLHVSVLGKSKPRLFYPKWEDTPMDDAGWDAWLNEETGMLGYMDITTPSQIPYERSLAKGMNAWTSPIRFDEVINFGTMTKKVSRRVMRFERDITSNDTPIKELLMASLNEADDEAYVEVCLGMELDKEFLEIL